MSWDEIRGHQRQVEHFRRAAARGRLASTFLFVGPDGIGKRLFARQLARALYCQKHSEAELQSCDTCPSCLQVTASSHPDLLQVRKPDNKNSLPLGMLIGDDDYGPGLCHDIALKPAAGGRRIAIIDDADFFKAEAANALLKTLEEPPPRSILILLGTSEQQQLPTILSRCQIIRFSPLSHADLDSILRKMSLEEGTPLEQLVPAAGGSVQRALLLHNPDAYAFRSRLIEQLASLVPGKDDFLQTLLSFTGDKEVEGAVKRARLHFIADLATEFYGLLAQQLSGLEPATDDLVLRAALSDVATRWSAPVAQLSEMIERTHLMSTQIGMNVQPVNLLGPWLMDLTNLGQGKHLLPLVF
jgi:DNA polymerase-3 subunit delta'